MHNPFQKTIDRGTRIVDAGPNGSTCELLLQNVLEDLQNWFEYPFPKILDSHWYLLENHLDHLSMEGDATLSVFLTQMSRNSFKRQPTDHPDSFQCYITHIIGSFAQRHLSTCSIMEERDASLFLNALVGLRLAGRPPSDTVEWLPRLLLHIGRENHTGQFCKDSEMPFSNENDTAVSPTRILCAHEGEPRETKHTFLFPTRGGHALEQHDSTQIMNQLVNVQRILSNPDIYSTILCDMSCLIKRSYGNITMYLEKMNEKLFSTSPAGLSLADITDILARIQSISSTSIQFVKVLLCGVKYCSISVYYVTDFVVQLLGFFGV